MQSLQGRKKPDTWVVWGGGHTRGDWEGIAEKTKKPSRLGYQ